MKSWFFLTLYVAFLIIFLFFANPFTDNETAVKGIPFFALACFFAFLHKMTKDKELDEEFIAEMEELRNQAIEREEALDFEAAIEIWEELGEISEAARIRKLIIKQGKVDQTVVQGDQITKTEIKDSVVNRSNVGADNKFKQIEKLGELKDKGLLTEEEFQKEKNKILI